MSDEFRVRQYEPADRQQVWAVHERALRASPIAFVEDAPADRDLTAIEEQYLDQGTFLVGLVGDDIVAIGGFQRAGETAEIRRLRVDPDWQGQGYGSRLLSALERRAQERGVDRLVLETNAQLRAARRLYESTGYKETGRETRESGDVVVAYRKPL